MRERDNDTEPNRGRTSLGLSKISIKFTKMLVPDSNTDRSSKMHGGRKGKYILLLMCREVFPLLFVSFLMNLFTAVLGLPRRSSACPSCREWGYGLAAVRGLPTAVASLLLQTPGSRFMGCSNCGP